MNLPSDVWDTILVLGGPMDMATDHRHVAACRLQRKWKQYSGRICRPPWTKQHVRFRWKRMSVPFHGIDPTASIKWRRGVLHHIPDRDNEWGIKTSECVIAIHAQMIIHKDSHKETRYESVKDS